MNKLYLIATGALLSGIITIQAQEWKPQQWPVLKKYDKEHLYQIALPLGSELVQYRSEGVENYATGK